MTARRFLKMEVIYGNKKNNQEVKLPLNIKKYGKNILKTDRTFPSNFYKTITQTFTFK